MQLTFFVIAKPKVGRRERIGLHWQIVRHQWPNFWSTGHRGRCSSPELLDSSQCRANKYGIQDLTGVKADSSRLRAIFPEMLPGLNRLSAMGVRAAMRSGRGGHMTAQKFESLGARRCDESCKPQQIRMISLSKGGDMVYVVDVGRRQRPRKYPSMKQKVFGDGDVRNRDQSLTKIASDDFQEQAQNTE